MPLPWTHLQAGLDHLPLRAVDHDRHARDLGLAGDQIEEADHRRLRIEHRLVHVDVDDLRAVLDLLPRHARALPRTGRSRIRRAKAFEPVTLVRSPTLTKREPAPSDGSRPESLQRRASVMACGCCAVARVELAVCARSARRDRPARAAGTCRRAARSARCAPASCRSSRRRCSGSPALANSSSRPGSDLGRLVEAGLAHRIGQAGVRIAATRRYRRRAAPAPRDTAASALRRGRS